MPQTTILHYQHLNENTFTIYLMNVLMNSGNAALPISIDRSRFESRYGADIILPFDSLPLYLQLKVVEKRGIYFYVPNKQIKAMKKNLRVGLPSFFVFSCYKKINELIWDFTNKPSSILKNTAFINPKSNLLKTTKKTKCVRFDAICQDCPPNENSPNGKRRPNERWGPECLGKFVSIYDAVKSLKMETTIEVVAKEKFSFIEFFEKHKLPVESLLTSNHMFVFLKKRNSG